MDKDQPVIEKFGDVRVMHDADPRHLPLTTIVRRVQIPAGKTKRAIPITK